MKNKVFLSEDMKRLYYIRTDQQIQSYSLERDGVLLQVIGNSIHASSADDESLVFYHNENNPNLSLKETQLLSMELKEKNELLNAQVQLCYIEKARTIDLIGWGDIGISFSGGGSDNVRKLNKGESFKIEMVKVVKEGNRGKFITNILIKIKRNGNQLVVSKIG